MGGPAVPSGGIRSSGGINSGVGAGTVRVDRDQVRKVCECMRRVFPEAGVSEGELLVIAEEAYRAADRNYGIEVAIKWGEDFVWDKDVASRDLVKLKRNNYDIGAMTQEHHSNMAKDRLSVERIEAWVSPDDPDRARLVDLAHGMRVISDDEFAPNNRAPRQRSLYKRAQKPVNKLFQEMWKLGLV